MPSKSEAQRRFMEKAAKDPAFAKAHDIPVSVAREFVKADRAKLRRKKKKTTRKKRRRK